MEEWQDWIYDEFKKYNFTDKTLYYLYREYRYTPDNFTKDFEGGKELLEKACQEDEPYSFKMIDDFIDDNDSRDKRRRVAVVLSSNTNELETTSQ